MKCSAAQSERVARANRFVALSGHGYEERIRARQVGFDDYLMKPFDSERSTG